MPPQSIEASNEYRGRLLDQFACYPRRPSNRVLGIVAQTRPQLSIKLAQPYKLENDPGGRPNLTWLRVEIQNELLTGWRTWISRFYDRSDAFGCQAWISFHHLDYHAIFAKEMMARWDDTPEPQIQKCQLGQAAFSYLGFVQNTFDIPTGLKTTIAIANKFGGDDDCFGWTNESYVHEFRHPSWRLAKGRYIARVRVRASGRDLAKSFMLFNDGPFSDFRLEQLARDEETKISKSIQARSASLPTQRLIIVGSRVRAYRAAAHAISLSAVTVAASGGARCGERRAPV